MDLFDSFLQKDRPFYDFERTLYVFQVLLDTNISWQYLI